MWHARFKNTVLLSFIRFTTNIVVKMENSSYLSHCYRMLDSQNSWSHLIGLPCIIYGIKRLCILLNVSASKCKSTENFFYHICGCGWIPIWMRICVCLCFFVCVCARALLSVRTCKVAKKWQIFVRYFKVVDYPNIFNMYTQYIANEYSMQV